MRTQRPIFLALLFIATGTNAPAAAAETTPPTPPPREEPPSSNLDPDSTAPAILPGIGAELFSIDRSHSQLDFIIRFLGMTDVRGTFENFTASILYDESDMSNTSITLSIDAETIDTQQDWRDRDLRSERFFDTEAFPTIFFQSERTTQDGDGFVAHGKLTMKGVTREIAVPFERMLKRTVDDAWGNVRIGFKGALTLDRNDYNIHGGDFWGIKALSEEVRIEFALLGTRLNMERIGFQSAEKPSIGEKLESIVEAEGIDAAIAAYHGLKQDDPDGYNFAEAQMNVLGYKLLRRGRVDEALAVFQLNAEVRPESSNVYDSLGETFATMGDVDKALHNYRKALALDPTSANAMEMLRRLEAAVSE